MNTLINLITPELEFVKANSGKIIFVLISASIFIIGYIVTSYSLKKLKPEIFSYYPFDKFFPKSGNWSVIYFLITIVLLAALVYVIIKGGFFLSPA